MRRFWLGFIIIGGLFLSGAFVLILSDMRAAAPVRSAIHFPWQFLAEEAEVMNDCVECHEPEVFHTCASCHDDHGAVEMASIPFNELILLQGDVPNPGYLSVNDILPYSAQPGTHVTLQEVLAMQDVGDFESVTLVSRDEGWITVDRANLNERALILPYVDGVRFAAEDLHVSTWLKGVWRMIVVGPDKPLILDGYRTSMGRLLLGPTRTVTIEQTDVMLRSENDGQVRKAKTASRVEGIAIGDIVADPAFDMLTVKDSSGTEHQLTDDEAAGAVLAQMGADLVLVLPNRGRSQWITGVVELVTEE